MVAANTLLWLGGNILREKFTYKLPDFWMLKSDGDISKDGGLNKGGILRVHCSYIFTCKREITTLEYAKDNHNNSQLLNCVHGIR
jgi:hypothetical protein